MPNERSRIAHNAARRAQGELAYRHRREYLELLNRERARVGLPPLAETRTRFYKACGILGHSWDCLCDVQEQSSA